MNSCQAWWALFFTCFYFILTYHPSSKNTKAYTLSRQYPNPENISEPVTILSLQCFINSITWKFDQSLNNTLPYDVPEG